ncbi:MAG: glycosyltransferase family 4 protein [Bacteroidales bacterium]|nr:glycosyltransferase family 4 protein [Bacteroidales bacterium]
MRILMVLDHEFPPDIRVENEIEALTASGNEVHIACYTRENRKSVDIFQEAVIHRKVISTFHYKSSIACLKFPFYFNFWRSFITELFKDNSFEAIHIHDLPLAKVGYEFSQKHNIPFILDLHENWPAMLRMATHTQTFLGKLLSTNKQWESYELKCSKKATQVIVVVEEAKDRLVKRGISGDKISVVSNTLNFNHFSSPKTKPDTDFITLMYAGGITKHRGLQFVIEGLKFLTDLSKPIRLWILGEGSYVQELKKMASDYGVEKQVVFAGWKEFEEMQSYLGKSDICLIPHIKSDHTDSTIPHKLFQYMYSRKPIIASNCFPIERILEETKSGLVYPFNDALKFANSVRQLIEEPLHTKKMQQNGIQAVKEKYNWLTDARVLQNIYA